MVWIKGAFIMKKTLVEFGVLVAILGVTASQVKTTRPTTQLSATEKKIEAIRLDTGAKRKWTAKQKVAGVPLQANQSNAAAGMTTPKVL